MELTNEQWNRLWPIIAASAPFSIASIAKENDYDNLLLVAAGNAAPYKRCRGETLREVPQDPRHLHAQDPGHRCRKGPVLHRVNEADRRPVAGPALGQGAQELRREDDRVHHP